MEEDSAEFNIGRLITGKLKLLICWKCNMLTVHIISAKNLKTKETSGVCNPFVKVSLIPDKRERRKYKTKILQDTTRPYFDEIVTFEAPEVDCNQRLLISVWNAGRAKPNRELIGCMSFRLLRIASEHKVIDGWFYLLTHDVGLSHHLEVPKNMPTVLRNKENEVVAAFAREMHRCHSQDDDCDSFVCILQTVDGTFGVSVAGSNPAFIAKVKKGQPADVAGLRENDVIVGVNDRDVTLFDGERISRLISALGWQLKIEVHRKRTRQQGNQSARTQKETTVDDLTSCPIPEEEIAKHEFESVLNEKCYKTSLISTMAMCTGRKILCRVKL